MKNKFFTKSMIALMAAHVSILTISIVKTEIVGLNGILIFVAVVGGIFSLTWQAKLSRSLAKTKNVPVTNQISIALGHLLVTVLVVLLVLGLSTINMIELEITSSTTTWELIWGSWQENAIEQIPAFIWSLWLLICNSAIHAVTTRTIWDKKGEIAK